MRSRCNCRQDLPLIGVDGQVLVYSDALSRRSQPANPNCQICVLELYRLLEA